jgi:hypothetical protein
VTIEEAKARVMRKALRECSKPLAVTAFWRYVQDVAQTLRMADGFVEWGLVRSRVQGALEPSERDFPGIASEVPGTVPPTEERTAAPLTLKRIALLRLNQRNMALDDPDPMVPVTSRDLLRLLDAAERSARVAPALREAAAWREESGDIVEPRALRNFADSIDPYSEEYDPNQDPLVVR